LLPCFLSCGCSCLTTMSTSSSSRSSTMACVQAVHAATWRSWPAAARAWWACKACTMEAMECTRHQAPVNHMEGKQPGAVVSLLQQPPTHKQLALLKQLLVSAGSDCLSECC
jgi:hypothetical protein